MRSVWALDSKTLEGYHDHLNNTLIESWSVNSMKHVPNKSYYPQLKQIVKDCKIPKTFYDSDRASEIIQLGQAYA